MKQLLYISLFLLGAWTAYLYVERAGQQTVVPQPTQEPPQPTQWPASPGKDKG